MDYSICLLRPMNESAAEIISEWEYAAPYDVYNFKGRNNGYLLNKAMWGIEQFCLVNGESVVGQVACQFSGEALWVGWSLAPELCGRRGGAAFISKCADEIRRIKGYVGPLYLKVAAWNRRAVRAYEKAGFSYVETITDEIAYTNNPMDFWVMNG